MLLAGVIVLLQALVNGALLELDNLRHTNEVKDLFWVLVTPTPTTAGAARNSSGGIIKGPLVLLSIFCSLIFDGVISNSGDCHFDSWVNHFVKDKQMKF